MEKRISVVQYRAIKRIAQAVNPLVEKAERLKTQFDKVKAEYEDQKYQVESMEQGVMQMTGGITTQQLFNKVVIPNGKFDKAGKALKDTKYEPTGLIHKDEEKGDYVITLPEPNEGTAPTPCAGTDSFDAYKEPLNAKQTPTAVEDNHENTTIAENAENNVMY